MDNNFYIDFKPSNTIDFSGTNLSSNLIGIFTLKLYSNKLEIYKDGTYLSEKSISISGNAPINWTTGGGHTGRWIKLKDFKIQEL